MRVAEPIHLREDVRRKLEQQARGRSTAARVVARSRIVLLAADGLQNKQIAETLKVAPRMAALWRGRFLEQGIEGLLQDAPRPGRTPSISADVTARLIAKTTQSTPAHATHWSTRTMAKAMGVSKASVSRIWRANGLKPHRVESFKVSNDPEFADKLEAIVGLYLHPPEHALVLSVDEKSQIQAHSRPGSRQHQRPGALGGSENRRPGHNRRRTQRQRLGSRTRDLFRHEVLQTLCLFRNRLRRKAPGRQRARSERHSAEMFGPFSNQ
jgi:transposase